MQEFEPQVQTSRSSDRSKWQGKELLSASIVSRFYRFTLFSDIFSIFCLTCSFKNIFKREHRAVLLWIISVLQQFVKIPFCPFSILFPVLSLFVQFLFWPKQFRANSFKLTRVGEIGMAMDALGRSATTIVTIGSASGERMRWPGSISFHFLHSLEIFC